MTWTRLSDDYTDRLDLLDLSRSARLLDVEGLVWCNRNTTDGYLPRAALRKVTDSPDANADVEELIAAGRWTDVETGWQLDWSDQIEAEEVAAERERWARQKKRQRLHNKGDHSICDPKRCWALLRQSTGESAVDSQVESRDSRPDPSRSDPTPREGRERVARADACAGAPAPHAQTGVGLGSAPSDGHHPFTDDGTGESCSACGLPVRNYRHGVAS